MTLVKFGPVGVIHPKNKTAQTTHVPLNIFEKPDAFIIQAALPGVDKNTVDLKVEKNQLHLKVDFDVQLNDDIKIHRRSFGSIKWDKVFNLPKSVNQQAISADFESGVLHIILPKLEDAIDPAPRNIQIQ